MSAPRVLAYSYDGMGLGHLRRNLKLLAAIGRAIPDAAMLTVTGSGASALFDLPPRTDLLRLPGLVKSAAGASHAARLPIGAAHVRAIRAATLEAVVRSFRPDLILVDFYPLGRDGELRDALLTARRVNDRCRIVLGIRDVIDDPATVASEWQVGGHLSAVAEYYDTVLIYGDPVVYDAVAEYRFDAAFAVPARYTGYLADHHAPRSAATGPDVVCTMGGGADAADLATVFLDAMSRTTSSATGLLVTGPFMDATDVARLTRAAPPNVTVERFHDDLPGLFASARMAVSMAGYNTTCELLATGTPAVLVPRTRPRQEQLIRSQRLAPFTGWTVLEPHDLSDVRLAMAIDHQLADRSRPAVVGVRLNGIATTASIVAEHLHAALPIAEAVP